MDVEAPASALSRRLLMVVPQKPLQASEHLNCLHSCLQGRFLSQVEAMVHQVLQVQALTWLLPASPNTSWS